MSAAGATADYVVVGSGINGLVAAAELALAGRSVALVERNDRLGGFIDSEQLTRSGYVHDTWSSWHPEFITGGAYAVLGQQLERHGLRYRNTEEVVTAAAAADGRVTLAHRDPQQTAAAFAEPADRRAYLEALDATVADLPALGALLGSELRSRAVLAPVGSLARRGRMGGLEHRLRDVAASGRAWLRRTFDGHDVDHLWTPWLLHAGLSPDHAGGGIMLPVFAATLHGAGLPVVEGGQGRFLRAFEALLAERGAQIFRGEEVTDVLLQDGRAVGIRTDARTITADHAVLASVAPAALYDRMLPAGAVPDAIRHEALRFRPGRAAMQVHVALSAPLAWDDRRLDDVPVVHLGDGASSTAIACAEAEAGLLPRHATVVVGQQSRLDPTRVPEGAGSLWIQLQELPNVPLGDAAGELVCDGRWEPALAAAYAERILDRIEAHAPGLRERMLDVVVRSPADLEAHNPNAIGGDPYGGAADLDQRLLWRPFPKAARHQTAVPGLWHIGAATHPGPGLNGASGHLVAQALLASPNVLGRARAAVARRRRPKP